MNTNYCPCCGRTSDLSISLASIPLDRRRRYVDGVCKVLNESRFGLGRTWQSIVILSDEPETQDAVFFDLTDEGLVPCYTLSPYGQAGYQIMEAMLREHENPIDFAGRLSPTTITARGSPAEERIPPTGAASILLARSDL